MKKSKRQPAEVAAKTAAASVAPAQSIAWWKWGIAFAGLLLVFLVYGPALDGGFVFDDRYLPFQAPGVEDQPLSGWITGLRPLLMFSFWIDYQIGKTNPNSYHVFNVLLHFFSSVLIALIVARLVELAGVAKGKMRALLAIAAGGVFLLHPLQSESVGYIASRSEVLSVLFYFAAYAVFLYCRTERMTIGRALAVCALFGCAFLTKEHTLTLPILLVVTDYLWKLGGIRKHAILYGLLLAAGAVGGVLVLRVLRGANTAGFSVAGLSPASYFFTQCRVLWTYIRMFFLPYGQNVDPDVAISHGLMDHGAIFGLASLLVLCGAAWFFRKQYPLAAFGVIVFLLLMAPTSSFVPIKDVLAERRMYLPMLGLLLICVDLVRRLTYSQLVWPAAAGLALCAIVAHERNKVWNSPIALWTDSTAKSPNKVRPRFQLAQAYYEEQRYTEAVSNFEIAARLAPPDDALLIDWALALDGAGRRQEAADKLRQAAVANPTAHVYSQLAMIYGKMGENQKALDALAVAEKLDANFLMTYVYRGNVFVQMGDRAAAAREFNRALAIDPKYVPAIEGLRLVNR
jgi:Tfp pilus assembly protein PilF